MSAFYPGQRVRYVGEHTVYTNGVPAPVKTGDTGAYVGQCTTGAFEGLVLAAMDRGIDLVCAAHNLEPILPEGLESPEEITELYEPEPELVEVRR